MEMQQQHPVSRSFAGRSEPKGPANQMAWCKQLFDEVVHSDSSRVLDQPGVYAVLKASFGVLGVPVCDNLLDASATAMLKIAVDKRAAADRPIMLTRGVRPSMLRLSLPMGTAGSIGWQYKPPAGQHGVQPALDVDMVRERSSMEGEDADGSQDASTLMKEAESYTMTVGELNALLAEKQNKMLKNKPSKMMRGRLACCAPIVHYVAKKYNKLTTSRFVLIYTLVWMAFVGTFIAGYLTNRNLPGYKLLEDHGYSGGPVGFAKAFAYVIQLALLLLLLMVCRRTITVLRETPLKILIPFDESISLHRQLGLLILLAALGHTAAAMTAYIQEGHILENTGMGNKGVHYLFTSETAITGYIAWGAIIIAYPFALSWPRMSAWIRGTWLGRWLNNFQWFYWTHVFLFVVFVGALLVHPLPGLPGHQHTTIHSVTWIYMLLPVSLYLCERLYRWFYPAVRASTLMGVELLPGKEKVICLRVRKPPSFNYRPGQYTFVCVPAVAIHEWHPFTISSAPGNSFVSVHIRVVGDWTTALWTHLQEHILEAASAQELELDGKSAATIKPPRVLLDGPYAAPAQEWQDYEVVLLVGAGIGITPFASVLTDLVNRMKKRCCRLCHKLDSDLLVDNSGLKTKKVYLHWTVRDSQVPNYFRSTLEGISRHDTTGVVDLRIHLTGAATQTANDLCRAMVLTGQEALRSETGTEMLVGLDNNVVVSFGRPDWDDVFQTLKERHPGTRIGVFVCGPKPLSKELKRQCIKHTPRALSPGSTKGPQAAGTSSPGTTMGPQEGELEEELREMMGDNNSHITAPTLFDCFTENF